MKITHNKVGQNLNTNDTGRAEKATKAGKSAVPDAAAGKAAIANAPAEASAAKVSLSSRAQDVMKAKEIAMAAPEIREDRVAELQKAIDAGKYKVDAKEVADKMVDEEAQWA